MKNHVLETGTLYNADKLELFKEKNAAQTFLDPVGMYSSFPNKQFKEDRSSLGKEEETLLFKALHFVRYRLGKSLDCENSDSAKVDFWYEFAIILRNRIVSANIGLIYGCMHRTSVRLDTDTMLSEGSGTLIRSAELFDPWHKNRFSTYACSAIIHKFSSVAKKKDWTAVDVDDLHPAIEAEDETVGLWKDRVKVALQSTDLTDQERQVLTMRFYQGQRLIDVGGKYNRSKERIRQIQIKALGKMKKILELDDSLDLQKAVDSLV